MVNPSVLRINMRNNNTVSTLKEAYDLELQQIAVKQILFPPTDSILKLCNDRSFWENLQSKPGLNGTQTRFNATEMSRVYLDVCSEDLKNDDGLSASDWLEFPFVKRLFGDLKVGEKFELKGYSLDAVCDDQDQIWMSPDLFRLFAGWLDPSFSDAVESFGLTKTFLIVNFTDNDSAPQPKPKRYVYLIGSKCKQVMKIGISRDVDLRLSTLQSSNALDLDLLFWIEGDSNLEASLLARFSHLKIRGEWLTWDKRIASHFRLLKKEQTNG